jgi:formate/nitrite transporter FocA (FNT family)
LYPLIGGLIVADGGLVAFNVKLDVGRTPVALASERVEVVVFNATVVVLPYEATELVTGRPVVELARAQEEVVALTVMVLVVVDVMVVVVEGTHVVVLLESSPSFSSYRQLNEARRFPSAETH